MVEFENNQEVFASFWQRLFALFIDGLVLMPIFALDWYNKVNIKSSTLLIVTSVIGILYKPLLEFKWGATVGKMAVHIKVVNKDYQNLSFFNALARNVFDIGNRLTALFSTLIVFGLPAFQNITTLNEFGLLHATVIGQIYMLYLPFLIVVIEIICLTSDPNRRSLHDRIASTFVVVRY